MIEYVSNKGGHHRVDFETAVLNGRPPDGGLYVPIDLPQISLDQLRSWKHLKYTDLAYEVLSLFIDRSVVPSEDLKTILEKSFDTFFHFEKIPFHSLSSCPGVHIQELFHGPTLSFKDVAMGFVVNLFDFFLRRKGKTMTIAVATSGDTGPAATFAAKGKPSIDVWALYPEGFITEEQERQMTTIMDDNVFPVRVLGCPNGSDDLDELITSLFADKALKDALNLSSVNSLNWGRIMMQTVHYFYGYLQMVDEVGELLNFAVPAGAFGNLCAGTLAREMGLPVGKFILANNQNSCLDRMFRVGIYQKEDIIPCPSSAIDISIPINFWRYLYFITGKDGEKVKGWMEEAESTGRVVFDKETHNIFRRGFITTSISDEKTLDTIQQIYRAEGYLLDPHAAVSVAAALDFVKDIEKGSQILCLATAHPSKFPEIICRALGSDKVPPEGMHPSIEAAKNICQKVYECHYANMHDSIPETIKMVAQKKHKFINA
jgi:threonine synthase